MTSAADCLRRPAWAALLWVPVLLLQACTDEPPGRTIELRGPTMGTTWSVKLVPGPQGVSPATREYIDRDVRSVLTRIERLMSTWDPESELSRFNRSRSVEPFPVSTETFEVFRWAVAFSEETGGAFDVTVSPLVEAWGFGAGGDPSDAAPDPATLTRLQAATGVRHLQLDPERRWVRKQRPDVECDFSAIAPGYAADRIAAVLASRGVTDFLIDVGGELLARGHSEEGQAWRVAVERPDDGSRRIGRVVPLRNAAIATSGDYRNYREVNGERVSHIIDPRTGRPVGHRLASVTVVDAQCIRADALATALMVLGPEDGMALARRLDLPVLFVLRTAEGGFSEQFTPQFDALTRIQ